ncbi:MAG: PfkB family carbohydrate kinase, partial [Thermodesulfobacteriota bacterium]
MSVVGLGQCSLDYIASVEEFPSEDTKLEIVDWTPEGGGPVATALVALSRLGVKTTFIGRVSDDTVGGEIKKGLKAEGVDTRGLLPKKGGRSQTAFIVVNRRTGSRTILWQRPTVEELRAEDVKLSWIKGKKFLLLDGLMHEASIRAAEIARDLGVPVMFDAGRVREDTLELAALSDYIVGSEEFATGLSGSPGRAIMKLTRLAPRAVTITLGRRGSITWSGGGRETFRTTAPGVRAVDTTGAGDV